jgi:hypothetical protein
MLKTTISIKLIVNIRLVYKGLRKGLLTAKATQVERY